MFVLVMAVSAFGGDKLIVQNSSSVTQFVVTDSGYTGIGTASPESQLYVVDETGTNSQRGIITAQHYSGANAAIIQFKRSRGTASSPVALQNGDNGGAFHSYLYDGSAYNLTSSIQFKVNGSVSAGGGVPTDMVFLTGAGGTGVARTERMRITSAGNIGIGTSTPSHLIQLSGGAYSDGSSWLPSSSRALKDNIKLLTKEEALDAFDELVPVAFTYKKAPDQQRIGFIAEDVPELAAMKDRKSVDPMNFIGILTKVLQEKSQTIDKQQKTIDAMAAKLQTIEAELANLKNR
jgi:hypothetical protein